MIYTSRVTSVAHFNSRTSKAPVTSLLLDLNFCVPSPTSPSSLLGPHSSQQAHSDKTELESAHPCLMLFRAYWFQPELSN